MPALTTLMSLSFGPEVVVGEEFAGVEGAEQVIIYGSWAQRYAGTEGPEPGDVDVLVVGAADREQVYDAADRAQGRLGLDVNPTLRSAASWESAGEALVATIKNSDYVIVASADAGDTA